MKIAFQIIVIGIFFSLFSCSRLSETEKKMVGVWRLTDYADNLQRDDTTKAAYLKEIEGMKQMKLVLNDDYSYVRSLGLQTEIGEWKTSQDGKFFITKPTTQNAPAMSIGIESVTEKVLTFRIVEGQAITRMVFQKQ